MDETGLMVAVPEVCKRPPGHAFSIFVEVVELAPSLNEASGVMALGATLNVAPKPSRRIGEQKTHHDSRNFKVRRTAIHLKAGLLATWQRVPRS